MLYPFQAVACMKDDGREKNIEENLRVKGNLKATKTKICINKTAK